MPSQTFYHLPEEKQARIRAAALHEFSAHPLKQARVAAIIAEAKISRGAFYKYFENLEDLYGYFYEYISIDAHQLIFEVLKEKQGDLFVALSEYFKRLLTCYSQEMYADYYRMMLLHQEEFKKSSRTKTTELQTEKDSSLEIQKQFFQLIDTKQLKLENGREYQEFIVFLTAVMHELIKAHLLYEQPIEKTIAQFEQRMQWLAFGVKESVNS
ncbi:hypothetical protein IGI37_001828 [Enterococcus sp. AZ194]|uniref:TetR family transcriptional regulator n=1 Tax=Enterococcus sp. AZ194 TaxID=2774629 RepID=UPI003F258775